MKTIKIFALTAVILAIGISNINAKKPTKNTSTKKMAKTVEKDLVRSFLEEDISQFVINDKKTKVTVTLRICKNCCIEILKVEGATEKVQALLKETINSAKVKTNEICKYRRFKVPLTFVYRK